MMIISPLFSTHIYKPLTTLLVSLYLLASPVQAQDITLDKIVAVVNDDVIMFSEVKEIALRIKQSGGANMSDQSLIKDTLDKLILEKVQLQKAQALGIKIDNVALNRAMTGIAEQNKLNLEQFKIALVQEGHNYKQFRESLREKLYIQSLQKQHQGSKQTISENEIDDLIRAESFSLNKNIQYQLLDILLPAHNGISVQQFNQKLRQAQILRKQILAKTDIVATAIIKKSGAQEKNLGWRNAQSLSPAFLRSLSLMGVGELSNVVRDATGFHILKIIEQRGGKRKISQQANVRHILIPNTDPQAKLKVTQLRNKILAGASFAKLARENSADKGSAQQGGDLGLMEPSSFVPPFAKAVTNLPLNTLSQPIQTRFGWHILEVLERKTSDKTREALKAQAQSLIGEKKQTSDYKNWLQGLRDEAFVEYRL